MNKRIYLYNCSIYSIENLVFLRFTFNIAPACGYFPFSYVFYITLSSLVKFSCFSIIPPSMILKQFPPGPCSMIFESYTPPPPPPPNALPTLSRKDFTITLKTTKLKFYISLPPSLLLCFLFSVSFCLSVCLPPCLSLFPSLSPSLYHFPPG